MVSAPKQLLVPVSAACLLAVGGLVLSNPTPADFEGFAAGQLVQLVEQEVCHQPALPLLLQLVIQNCPAMVQAQSQSLGRLARDHSQRINLGIASIYTTRFGGQQVLPNWRVPNYGVMTLAAAGHFVVLSTSARP